MGLNYTVYYHDGSRNAVVMTDMNGKRRACKLCEYCHASEWLAGLCGCVE